MKSKDTGAAGGNDGSARPEVSVILITYNHERWIAQAIESVLAQQADFRVELLISEDCSSDGTRIIIKDYQMRFPDRIRVFFSPVNLCDNTVMIRAWEAARGRYIAVLDGDDYWTSPYKLQRQWDLMERHAEYSACFHNAWLRWEDGSQEPVLNTPAQQPAVLTDADLWNNNVIAMSSILYRRDVIGCLPSWYLSAKLGDWELHLISASHGPIAYIPEVMSVYRKHAAGYWSGMSDIIQFQKSVEAMEYAAKCCKTTHKPIMRAANVVRLIRLGILHQELGNPWQSWRCLINAGYWSLANPRVKLMWLLKSVLWVKCPRSMETIKKWSVRLHEPLKIS